jgi:hypothetical protein
MSEDGGNDRALLVAMPSRHLDSAAERCRSHGSVVLPAGGPGELDDARPTARVLLIATDDEGQSEPAATWAAEFHERVSHRQGDPWPDGLPPTWVDEHPTDPTRDAPPIDPDDEDDDAADPDRVGPQAFFRVRALEPLSRSAWVFANEVVAKQRRGGRTFVPRVPILVELPD